MDQPPYSAIADLLNKFHTASEPIQALALIVAMGTVLGVCAAVAWCVVETVRVVVGRRRAVPGEELVYGVYADAEDRLTVVQRGPGMGALPYEDGLLTSVRAFSRSDN